MKKIAAMILSVLLILSVTACSSDSGSFDEIDASQLPSKINMRDYEGKNYVTPVKCQMFGDCWSFSLAGSAEIAYLFANDMGVPAGEVNDQVNFSEKYIAWYVFHGITKDDVIQGRVRASQVGEGFDLSEAEKTNKIAAYIIGGHYVHDMNLFGDGFGPVDESVSVNGEYPYAYNDDASVEWSLPLNAEYRGAPTDAFLRNSCVLPSPAFFDENDNYSLNEDGLNAIKSEICKGHGVSFGLNASFGFNRENMSVYHGGKVTPDHAVVAVGYDDDFPKEKFTRRYNTGEEIKDTTPPENGAFIIKNSWGTIDSEEDGYFYLSYYDQSITTALSYEFDNVGSLKHTDLNYDQYDLMMTKWYAGLDDDSETKMANVFDAEEDESLFRISYRTGSAMTEVSYEIYKGVEGDDPASGDLLEKGVGRHTYAGSHTIDLKREYELKKGERYAVVLTMKRVTDEEGNMVYTEVVPYSSSFFAGMTVRGVINKGESYLYADGKWSDMSAIKDSLIERVYQQGAEEIASDDPESDPLAQFDLDSKDAFTVDNYPIKAILSPKN